MDYDDDVALDAIDKEHLTDCYPRPGSNPPDLTAGVRELRRWRNVNQQAGQPRNRGLMKAPVRGGARRAIALAAAAGIVAMAAVVLAVSLPKAGSMSGDQPTTPTDAPVAISSAAPVAVTFEPTVSALPTAAINTPTPVSAELARSNLFWEPYVQFESRTFLDFDFASLADVTDEADLIIRGHMTKLYIGEHWVFNEEDAPVPLSYMTIQIDEVLKGVPVSLTPGFVEMMYEYPDPGWAPPPPETLPAGENLWFLKYDAAYWQLRGLPPRQSAIAPFAYFLPNHDQTVLRKIDGHVSVIRAADLAEIFGEDLFPVPLDGQNYEALVEQLRELVQAANPG